MGTRAAYPLLLDAAIAEYVRPMGLLHDWRVCVAIDLAALALLLALCRRPLKLEWIIGLLFVPAFVSYVLPDPWRYWGSSCVVITQLLLTIPLTKHQGIGGVVSHGKLREVKHEAA
jgi:hypothetical protein